MVIQPWDKSLLGEIEKAIQMSELSVNPNNDGKVRIEHDASGATIDEMIRALADAGYDSRRAGA